jgi:hypothetical protein
MAKDKIVLLTLPSDQGDILKDYIEWHLDLGVDLILAQDCGSSDNTHEILNLFSNRGQLQWFPMTERNLSRHSPADALAKMAIDAHGADWIIQSDVDEFLCPQGNDLRTILQRAAIHAVTAISVPCFNMTGRSLESSDSATETLTLRIDQPVVVTTKRAVSGNLPVPYMFVGHRPKTIARASAFVEYYPGVHEVITAWGRAKQLPDLHLLHYPIRGFDKFQTKVANAAAFFRENNHLKASWGWHWRRWVRLNREGRLREDYESQFVSPARAEELIRDGICTVDETVANWIKNKNSGTANASCQTAAKESQTGLTSGEA